MAQWEVFQKRLFSKRIYYCYTFLMSISIEQIQSEPWHKYGQPEWNNRTSVADAIITMWRAGDDLESCSTACDKLLEAIGNNHRGVYYPVLIAVMTYIEEILRTGKPWQIRVLLCLLDDLMQVFQSAYGFETLPFPMAGTNDVEQAFKHKIFELRPVLEHIQTSDKFNADVAKDLIEWLDENAA